MPEIYITLSVKAKDKLDAYAIIKNLIENKNNIEIIDISTDGSRIQ